MGRGAFCCGRAAPLLVHGFDRGEIVLWKAVVAGPLRPKEGLNGAPGLSGRNVVFERTVVRGLGRGAGWDGVDRGHL